jgi:hypothetical protein
MAMFFVTAPTLGENRVWALQSTQSAEFNSWDACDDFIGKHLIPSAQSTDTLSVFAWCAPKDFNGKERESKLKALRDARSKAATFLEKKAVMQQLKSDTIMREFGSCYSYIPAPVPISGKRKKQATEERQLLGSCSKP